MRFLISIFLTGFLTTTAFAQSTTVFGNSDAQECYMATKIPGQISDIRACNDALRYDSLSKKDKAATYINRGIHHTRAGNHSAALADFESALGLYPDLAEAFLNRGNTYIFLGNFADALSEYERALELGTKDPHAAYFNKGLAYEAMRNLTKAYESFQKANELQPEWALPIERLKRYEEVNYKSLQ